ncbi:MAG: insulinase family protein [Anaerolineae bacterium]|nr:insulinase family protein [Anaerolineae bacterium]
MAGQENVTRNEARSSSVSRHVFDNGLTVLLKEVHTAPVISWWMLYRVGSRNEHTGQTGISHWVEHMMFKGTDKFPAGVLDKAIDRIGGSWNAQTSFDYTAYYETMPASQIDLVLQAEADRMVNAHFNVDDVESERTVIISEREGSENDPIYWLFEETNAAAFRVHPYHHQIIGDMADLKSMTRDDLYRHYQTYYAPNNAIAVAVGDFETQTMLARIKELYEDIPSGPAIPPVTRAEPPQQGERFVKVERYGNTHHIHLLYRAPEATHPDWFKLKMIDSILSGASAPGSGGGGNKTSRLYKALVEKELASGVNSSLSITIDPHTFSLIATVRDGRTPEEVQAALDAEIDRLRQGEIVQAELDKAKKQAKALFAYGTETVTGQAYWLAFAENFASYEWYETYVEQLEAVTLDDVREVAQRYFIPSQRTVGWLIPIKGEN